MSISRTLKDVPCIFVFTTETAMEISGGQGANGPHLFGLASNFLEMGATVAPIFWPQQASKCGFPAKYSKNFARASGARTNLALKFMQKRRKVANFVKFA